MRTDFTPQEVADGFASYGITPSRGTTWEPACCENDCRTVGCALPVLACSAGWQQDADPWEWLIANGFEHNFVHGVVLGFDGYDPANALFWLETVTDETEFRRGYEFGRDAAALVFKGAGE